MLTMLHDRFSVNQSQILYYEKQEKYLKRLNRCICIDSRANINCQLWLTSVFFCWVCLFYLCLVVCSSGLAFSKLHNCLYNETLQCRFKPSANIAMWIPGRLCKHDADRSSITLQIHMANICLGTKTIRTQESSKHAGNSYTFVKVNLLKMWKNHHF